MACASGGKSEAAAEFPVGLSVLVVDDDVICLRVLEHMLRKCMYNVTSCLQATVALNLLRERKCCFDILLIDVYMPDMDGFELLELVRSEMDLPVIMMSADGRTGAIMRGIEHGACDYLVKPVRDEKLKNIWQHASIDLVFGIFPEDVPERSLELMNVPGLRREIVASHLQRNSQNFVGQPETTKNGSCPGSVFPGRFDENSVAVPTTMQPGQQNPIVSGHVRDAPCRPMDPQTELPNRAVGILVPLHSTNPIFMVNDDAFFHTLHAPPSGTQLTECPTIPLDTQLTECPTTAYALNCQDELTIEGGPISSVYSERFTVRTFMANGDVFFHSLHAPPSDTQFTECPSTSYALHRQGELTIEGGTISISSAYTEGSSAQAKHSNAAAANSKKNDAMKRTERGKGRPRLQITREHLEPHFGKKLKDVTVALGVSRSTIKRACRYYGILRWPYNEQHKKNPSLFEAQTANEIAPDSQQNMRPSNSSNLLVSQTQSKSIQHLTDQTETEKMMIKVNYEDDTLKFHFHLSSGMNKLLEEVAERLNLEIGRFKLKYFDEDNDEILLACDTDLLLCSKSMTAMGKSCIQLFVQLST